MSKFKLVSVRKASVLFLAILCLLGFGSALLAYVTPPPDPPVPPEEPNTNYYYWDVSSMWTVVVNISECSFDPATGLPWLVNKFSNPPARYSLEPYYGVMVLNPHSLFYSWATGFMDITSLDSDHQNIPIFTASHTVANSPFDFIYSGMQVDLLSNIKSITPDGTQIKGWFYDPNPPLNRSITVSYTAYGQAIKIFHPVVLKPEDKMGGTPISYLDKVSLNQENYTATTDLPYKAKIYGNPYTGIINWKNELKWEPSPQRSPLIKTITFATASEEEHSEKIVSMGGKLSVTASATLRSSSLPVPALWTSSGSSSGYIMITGPEGGIPKDEITAQLIDLYKDGATPRLMTGIAVIESGYLQFYKHHFNYPDLWMPRVSDDRPKDAIYGNKNDGSHVGLMQVPINMEYAWNWLANVQKGVKLFRTDKLAAAKRNEIRIIKDFKKRTGIEDEYIERLTGVQLENMALIYYGEHGSSDFDKQYYRLVEENRKGVWQKNIVGNSAGIAYADKIRKNMK